MATTIDTITDAPDAEQPSVLVVDDQRQVADLYATFLEDEYDVTAVYGGEAALEAVDGSYDVVLLDRRMPELSGDDVLEIIRNRNLGCTVAMVTAVDPDFDIIDMAFESYLSKPVSREEITATVEQLVIMAELEDVEYELSSLRVKRNVLEAELTIGELTDSAEFARLQDRIADLRARLGELRSRLTEGAPGDTGTA